MNKLDNNIFTWNFKKIEKIYLISLLVTIVTCATAAGIVFHDRIAFAWQYSRVNEAAEEANAAAMKTEIDKLASASSDVVDILMLDSSNNVTYSAKGSVFSKGQFELTRAENEKDYLVSKENADVVFKYVRGENFMLNSVFNTDFGKVRDEYRDESFFENGFGNKTVYMLGFLGEKNSDSKIYIISSPTTVVGGSLMLKIIATVGILFFMVYWVLLALWAWQNAAKSKLYPLFWGIIVLLTNIAGVIVYQLYKHANVTCPGCGASQSRLHLFCTNCGTKLGETCKSCGTHISKKDAYCSGCGKKLN